MKQCDNERKLANKVSKVGKEEKLFPNKVNRTNNSDGEISLMQNKNQSEFFSTFHRLKRTSLQVDRY